MAYDVCMALIVAFTTWRGAVKGVAWQIAGIAALVLCFLFATPVSLAIAPLIKVQPPLNRWIAMLATYLIFSFLCFAAARTIRGALEAAKFEEFDRHLGAAFGFVKGAALVFVITFFVVCLSESSAPTVLATHTGQISRVIVRNIHMVLPAEIDRTLAPYSGKLHPDVIAGRNDVRNDPRTRRDDTARGPSGYRPTEDFRGSAGRPADDTRTGQGRGPRIGGQEETDGDFGRDLRGAVQDAVRQGVEGAVRKTIGDVLTPAADPAQPPRRKPAARDTSALEAERRQLVRSIAAVFYSTPDDLAAAEVDIASSFQDVPVEVTVATLRDWNADLSGEPDPDPSTDVGTAIEARIARQWEEAGLPVDRLPQAVREKLSGRR
jgi:membrane protein required for colicin V production